MSDLFSLLQYATVVNTDEEVLGRVIGFEVLGGRMEIIVDDEVDDEEDDDPGSKEPIPEPNINDKIRAISGGKK